MTATLRLDFRDIGITKRKFRAFADQVPFALAGALNDAADKVRNDLITKTWPTHVAARNASFMKAALSTKGARATKKNLRVSIYDRLGRASLFLHAEGGTKRPRGQALAVPSKALAGRRGASGVPKGLRPRNVPNAFVKQSKYGPVLFQRTGTYQKAGTRGAKKAGAAPGRGYDGRRLKLMYGLVPSAPIAADVPFEASFARGMRREVAKAFKPRLKAALATRHRRK